MSLSENRIPPNSVVKIVDPSCVGPKNGLQEDEWDSQHFHKITECWWYFYFSSIGIIIKTYIAHVQTNLNALLLGEITVKSRCLMITSTWWLVKNHMFSCRKPDFRPFTTIQIHIFWWNHHVFPTFSNGTSTSDGLAPCWASQIQRCQPRTMKQGEN